jgi:hypothetical protein
MERAIRAAFHAGGSPGDQIASDRDQMRRLPSANRAGIQMQMGTARRPPVRSPSPPASSARPAPGPIYAPCTAHAAPPSSPSPSLAPSSVSVSRVPSAVVRQGVMRMTKRQRSGRWLVAAERARVRGARAHARPPRLIRPDTPPSARQTPPPRRARSLYHNAPGLLLAPAPAASLSCRADAAE